MLFRSWSDGSWMRQTSYHALFGAKFLLAMAAFYFASGLVGRGAGTEWIRRERAKWASVTLGLMLAVVLLSGWMRQLHTGANMVESGGVGMPPAASSRDGVDAGADAGEDRYRDGRAGAAFRGPPADVPAAAAPGASPAPEPANATQEPR